MTLRWNDYFLRRNTEYEKFWKEYLESQRDILFILGSGFDPRMCYGIESILEKDRSGLCDCCLINFQEGENSPSENFRDKIDENKEKLKKIIKEKAELFEENIQMENEEGHRTGPRKAANIFKDFSDFEKYSDIILDISSLPMNIYFPLLGKILYIIDKQKKTKINLHVIVAEDAIVDKAIKKRGLADEAEYLHGFTGNLNIISTEYEPTVWIPIFGEGQKLQIELINKKISPEEICPVLPSPSANPRRGDDLLLEYRDMVLNELNVESRNIIYGAEQNPFELYRQIQKTIEHYQDALAPIGKCKFALSSLSSKLMSIGAFFVVYEEGFTNKQNVGIVYVESKGYVMEKITEPSRSKNRDLFSLWITGDCYEN